MKKTTIFLGMSLMAMLNTACSDVENELADSRRAVKFTCSMEGGTRATDTQFEQDDDISVYAYQDWNGTSTKYHAQNVRYSYKSGAGFESLSPIYFPGGDTYLTFFAIYPYSKEGKSGSFTVKENQNEGDNYTLSDLMTGSTWAWSRDSDNPKLTFRHKLSAIVIKPDASCDSLGITRIYLCGIQPTVTYDLNNEDIDINLADTAPINIRMKAEGGNFMAILPPQDIQQGSTLLRIVTEKHGTFVAKAKDNYLSFGWSGGMRGIKTLTYDGYKLSLSGWEDSVEITKGTIDPNGYEGNGTDRGGGNAGGSVLPDDGPYEGTMYYNVDTEYLTISHDPTIYESSQTVTMVRHNDGSCSLINPYPDISSLTFIGNDDGSITITNADYTEGIYKYFYANSNYLAFVDGYGYSSYGNLEISAHRYYVYMYRYDFSSETGGYDIFCFNAADTNFWNDESSAE